VGLDLSEDNDTSDASDFLLHHFSQLHSYLIFSFSWFCLCKRIMLKNIVVDVVL